MSLLFCDSFDHYTTTLQKWTSRAQTPAPSAGNGRNGTASLRMGRVDAYVRQTLAANYQTLVVGAAFRTTENALACIVLAVLDAGAYQAEVRLNASSQLTVCCNGTVLATSVNTISSAVWYYIELKVYIHDTNGTIEVKVNGVSWASKAVGGATDTKNTANAYANQVQICGGGAASASTTDYDDFYCCDTAGPPNNDYLGDILVQALVPSGAGAKTQWSPSGSTYNYQCVDEIPPDDDTTFIISGNAGDVDTYAFGNTAVSSGLVKAVVVRIFARKDDAGARQIKPVVRPTSTDIPGAAQALADTYAYYKQIYEQNPEGPVDWTLASVNAAEFGVEMEA